MGAWFTEEAIRGFLKQYGLQLAIIILIVVGLWLVDHRGFERAKAEDRERELERQQLTAATVAAIDGKLDGKLRTIGDKIAGKIDTLDTEGKTVVQPIITREIERDPALASAACLTPGLLGAVNAARGYPAGELVGATRSANPPGVPGSGARH